MEALLSLMSATVRKMAVSAIVSELKNVMRGIGQVFHCIIFFIQTEVIKELQRQSIVFPVKYNCLTLYSFFGQYATNTIVLIVVVTGTLLRKVRTGATIQVRTVIVIIAK